MQIHVLEVSWVSKTKFWHLLRSFLYSIKHSLSTGSVVVPQKPFKTKRVEKWQFSFRKVNQLPLYCLFQIILSVFPSSSDVSTHFHIEIPSLYILYILHYTSYRVVSLRASWVTFDAPGWLIGIHMASIRFYCINNI